MICPKCGKQLKNKASLRGHLGLHGLAASKKLSMFQAMLFLLHFQELWTGLTAFLDYKNVGPSYDTIYWDGLIKLRRQNG